MMLLLLTSGLIDTYTLDDISGAWNKLNTLQLSKLHFAGNLHYILYTKPTLATNSTLSFDK